MVEGLSCEYRAFLCFLQAGLGMKPGKLPEEFSAQKVFKEAVLHSVAGLSYNGLLKLSYDKNIDASLLSAWKNKAMGEYMFLEGMFLNQKGIIDLFEKEGIEYAVLKGTSIAKEYESANLRMQSDVDIIVKKDKYEKAAELMKAEGFVHIPGGGDHHITLSKGKLTVEVHHTLGGLPDKKTKKIVDDLFADFYKNSVEAECNGHKFMMLPVKLQAVSLLLHLIQHMTRTGSGFRQVCDWALFAKKDYDEIFSGECKKILCQIGIFEFARIMTAFCNLYLNAEIPCDFEIDEAELSPLLEDVFASGEFGVKDLNRSRSRFFLNANSGSGFKNLPIIQQICSMHQMAIKRHKIFDKVVILKPFAFLCIPCGYVWRIIKGKNKSSTLKESMEIANKRNDIYKKMKLFK